MKVARRRPAADPAPADDTPSPPTPPRGRPVVAYASVDGRTLWLAVAAGPGSLGLRDAAGEIVPLLSTVADEQPGYLSASADLDDLLTPATDTATGTAAYEAVLVTGAGSAKALWSHPLPDPGDDGAMRPRVCDDGTHLWELGRRDDGTLRVSRIPQPPTVPLRSVRLDGDTVTLTTDAVAPVHSEPGVPELRLVGPEGLLVLTRPMTVADDGRLRATLSVADLPPGPEVVARLQVGDLPVRRRDDDLARAERATVLPVVYGDDLETPAMRFVFAAQGTLGVRLRARPGGVG